LLSSEAQSQKTSRRRVFAVLTGVIVGCGIIGVVMCSPTGMQKAGASPLEAEAKNSDVPRVPFFRVTASSSYDAGLQHGRLAKELIHGWLASAEMKSVVAFVAGNGSKAFQQLKTDNSVEFPEYAEEMRGIADGAGVEVDAIWCANMLNELESLMSEMRESAKHCSDVYAISAGGYSAGFAHGHNDDWSEAVKPFWYVMSVTYNSSAEQSKLGFGNCAGVAYHGALVGWAPTWNEHGMFATQNSLVPRKSRAGGLACAFVQRRAICGAHNLDEAVNALSVKGWSNSASMNVVDAHGKRMANVELWEDRYNVLEVTEAMNNYTHFNEFKHLETARNHSIDDPRLFVHDPRQARADDLSAPRSEVDVMARLSDSQIFRPTATITTVVLNGTTGVLRMWCGVPSASNPPAYTWDMFNFF